MIFVVLVNLVVLYLLSRKIIQKIYQVVYLATKSRSLATMVLAFLFFPGTVVHELSHWITAEILHIKTGEIVLHPIMEKHGQIRMGSVQIARSDPLRRLLIGLAPTLAGLILLTSITTFHESQGKEITFSFWNNYSTARQIPLSLTENVVQSFRRLNTVVKRGVSSIPMFYALFSIGTMMYSSKRDIEGLAVFVTAVMIIGMFSWVFHFSSIRTPVVTIVDILAREISIPLFFLTITDCVLYSSLSVASYIFSLFV